MDYAWLFLILAGVIIGCVLTALLLTKYFIHEMHYVRECITKIMQDINVIQLSIQYIEHGHGPSPVHHEVRHSSDINTEELERTVDDAIQRLEGSLNSAFRSTGLGSFGSFGRLGSLSDLSISPWRSSSYSFMTRMRTAPPMDPSTIRHQEQPAEQQPQEQQESREEDDASSDDDLDLELS